MYILFICEQLRFILLDEIIIIEGGYNLTRVDI